MKTPKINSRVVKLEVLKDTATRTSVNAVESRTTSLERDVATLTQGIQDAVSTHNTAPDAHADIRTVIAGKQDSLTISTVGTALLNLSTPTAAQIPRINADASVTLIDVPNVEEVDADFVSISGTAVAVALTIAGWSFDFVSLDSGDYEAWTSGTGWASAGGVTAQENISTDPVAYVSGGDYYELTGGTGWAGSGTLVQYTL